MAGRGNNRDLAIDDPENASGRAALVRPDRPYQARETDPGAPTQQLLATYRQKGWQASWALRLEVLERTGDADPCSGDFEALAAIRAGRPKEALTALSKAADRHCYWMGVARVNPLLDEVRGDPAFAEVLAPLHLPSSATR